jgi:hypothetical protein
MQNPQITESSVNYDEMPIAEAQIEGVDYRIDTGLGSAVAISCREAGTWAWTPVAEARWDGRKLRAKGLDHAVVSALGQALAEVMSTRDGSSFT